MGKIIRFISEAAPKFQTDWRPLGVKFAEIIPIDICCPGCGFQVMVGPDKPE